MQYLQTIMTALCWSSPTPTQVKKNVNFYNVLTKIGHFIEIDFFFHLGTHPSHIAIDFITDLPESRGNTIILTVIDRFSKSCRLIPLPILLTAFETVEILCNYVFRLCGLPEDIISDRGPQFTSRVWAAFFKHLNINVSLTSVYHPESNSQTDSTFRAVNQSVTKNAYN